MSRLLYLTLTAVAGLALAALLLAGAAGARGLTADDLVELKRLSTPAVSPWFRASSTSTATR